MAQFEASMSGVVLCGVVMDVGSGLARGKISLSLSLSLYIYIYIYIYILYILYIYNLASDDQAQRRYIRYIDAVVKSSYEVDLALQIGLANQVLY